MAPGPKRPKSSIDKHLQPPKVQNNPPRTLAFTPEYGIMGSSRSRSGNDVKESEFRGSREQNLDFSLPFSPPSWYNTRMENTTRTQRTPAEIIAETEARLERLRMKEAKVQAKANPAVSALMEERDEVQKDLREAKKLLGSGPQSAEARIAKHEAWIMRITEQVDEAEDALSSTEQRLSEIDKRISDEVASLMSSKELASEG